MANKLALSRASGSSGNEQEGKPASTTRPKKRDPNRARELKLIASRNKRDLRVVLDNGVEVLLPPILVGEAALAFGKESGLLNAKGQFAKRFR
jgi:hypothetical protein